MVLDCFLTCWEKTSFLFIYVSHECNVYEPFIFRIISVSNYLSFDLHFSASCFMYSPFILKAASLYTVVSLVTPEFLVPLLLFILVIFCELCIWFWDSWIWIFLEFMLWELSWLKRVVDQAWELFWFKWVVAQAHLSYSCHHFLAQLKSFGGHMNTSFYWFLFLDHFRASLLG